MRFGRPGRNFSVGLRSAAGQLRRVGRRL